MMMIIVKQKLEKKPGLRRDFEQFYGPYCGSKMKVCDYSTTDEEVSDYLKNTIISQSDVFIWILPTLHYICSYMLNRHRDLSNLQKEVWNYFKKNLSFFVCDDITVKNDKPVNVSERDPSSSWCPRVYGWVLLSKPFSLTRWLPFTIFTSSTIQRDDQSISVHRPLMEEGGGQAERMQWWMRRYKTQGHRSDKEALCRGSRAARPPAGHQGNILVSSRVSKELLR